MPSAGEVAGKVVFCICGPIGSLCCFVISLWGVIMLVRVVCVGICHTSLFFLCMQIKCCQLVTNCSSVICHRCQYS